MLLETAHIPTDKIEDALLTEKQLSLYVLRLDTIHPVISGNKLFKLHYFLADALLHDYQTIITFGGAYSNHLAACAYACHKAGLKCIGLVRGEKPAHLSHTLINCQQYGMQLNFLSREAYDKKDTADFIDNISKVYEKCLIIPEGGFHPQGAKGAALIMDLVAHDATHICTAVGTATTLAGLLIGANNGQQIIGIPVLKGMKDIEERILFLTGNNSIRKNLFIADEYHFGGYAKKNAALVSFMNNLYQRFQLPTDFVYTAKMMYGIFALIKQDHFPAGSKIVCIHTGGLQGNLSLPNGSLTFK